MVVSLVGDWMGSLYSVIGQRWDMHLFFDHNGRFEKTDRSESGHVENVVGQWQHDCDSGIIKLTSEKPDYWGRTVNEWRVMSINGFEDTNLVLVLRPVILIAPNLPIMLTRVHANERAYGTDWQQRLNSRNN